MAENAIEILIDVLTQEGITSTEDLIKVLTDAAGKAGALSDSIDTLDGSLSGIAKSGASAEDIAAKLVTTLEDFGVEVKDAEGLASALEGTLTRLGASSEKAAGGVDLLTKANEELAGPTNTATDSIERESGAVKGLTISIEEAAAVSKQFRAQQIAAATAMAAGEADLGLGFTRMTTAAELATPALMKAATWAGIGLAGLAYEGIKQYTQFNKLITQTITQAGEAPSKMGFLTNLAESVAKSTGANLDDVANTIYRAASGTAAWNNGLGATKAQLSGIVDTVSKLNVVGGIAGGAESEQASRVVTALLNSDIRGVGHNPTSAAALVNAVVGSGDMRLADLVPGIGRGLLSSAVANNLTAKDALAWVATLTSQGTTASVAGNYVKTGVNLLAHPSAQGVQALAMLGIKPGELENLMSGPGGLVAALSTLSTGMKQLNPGSAAKFFYHEAGKVYPGGSGLAGAIAKLQTWSAGELPASFIKAWEGGHLDAKQQTEATDLILTKAFGGSKQFATIAAVLNHLGLLKGIEAHIGAEDSASYFNAQYRRTEATPSQQFKVMGQHLLVDLVNIGKTLTPLALTFGHIMTGVIGGLSKFKGVIEGFAIMAGGLLALAGGAKLMQLGSHLAPLIGAGYNRLASGDGAFSTAVKDSANSGRFKFLNIYDAKKGKILSKLGGESIISNGLPADKDLASGSTVEGLSKGDNALLSAQARSNGFLEEIATNTRVSDAEGGGAGGARFGGRGGTEGVVEREASMATSTPRDAMYIGSGQSAISSDLAGVEEGSIFYSASSGRWMKRLAGGRQKFASADEVRAAGGSGQTAIGAGDGSANYITQRGESGVADTIALPEESMLGGVDQGLGQYGPELLPAAGAGVAEGGIMEGLGGLMGGPVGMMGMMMAPMLMGLATPLIGKLGSLLGDWFGGGSSKPFVAHIKGAAIDSTQASAKLQKDIKVLRQYQTEIKNKSGKEEWVRNQAAYLADPLGYYKALKKYQLASHTYTGSMRNSNAISSQAIDALYGSEGHLLSRDERLAKEFSPSGDKYWEFRAGGAAAQMRALTMQLPGTNTKGVRGAVMKMIAKNGINWQDFSKILSKDQSLARGILADTEGSSAQTNAVHNKLYSALSQGGYFQTGSRLSLNTSEMNRAMNERGATAAKAAQFLPAYAHQYHAQVLADSKALKTSPPDAKAYFEDQKKSAQESLDKTDQLIREMREAAKDTKIDGESVSKLAKENAQAIAASGLTADQIGAAVAIAIKSQLKTSRVVVGTGGTVSRTGPIFSGVPVVGGPS